MFVYKWDSSFNQHDFMAFDCGKKIFLREFVSDMQSRHVDLRYICLQ